MVPPERLAPGVQFQGELREVIRGHGYWMPYEEITFLECEGHYGMSYPKPGGSMWGHTVGDQQWVKVEGDDVLQFECDGTTTLQLRNIRNVRPYTPWMPEHK